MDKRKRKRIGRSIGIGIIATLLLIPQLMAQNPTGTLIGRVSDSEGGRMPGVTVAAISPNLQGERTAITGANGDYKLAFLPPGIYEISYKLEGFTPSVREVKISGSQVTTSDIDMSISEVTDEIIVTGAIETISDTNTAASTYTQDEVEKLAISRNLEEAALLTPGVTATGPGSTEEFPRIAIAGAMSFENLFLVNGVVVNENLRGQELPLFIEDAIQETTTSVSGVSAEYGRFTGGVVSAITKSGGNKLDGSLRVNLVNDDWLSQNELSPERIDDVNDILEGTLGGAFWQDHLWFFAAGRNRETSDSGTTRAVTNLSFPTTDEEDRLEGKLTLAATPSHNVIASYSEIDRIRTNTSFGTFLDLASLNPNREDPQEIKSINYTGILSSNFFVEAQYSERDFNLGIGSGGVPDLIDGTLIRRRGTNHRFHAPTFCGSCEDELRNNENALVKGSYFLTTENAGTHDIVFGYDTFDDIRFAINHQTGSDFTVYSSDILVDSNNNIFPIFNNDTAWVRWFAIINEDLATPTAFTTNSFYVNDGWQVNDRLSLNLGVRYDENDGTNSAGALVTDDTKVSPRLGATFDLRGDGDWIFNASYGTYVAAIANNRADSTSNGGAVSSFTWAYDGPGINLDANCLNRGDCTTSAEALAIIFNWYQSVGGTFDSPFNIPLNAPINDLLLGQSIPGDTSQILQPLKSPSTDEFTIGLTKRLGSRGSFRADLVNRSWTDFYSNRTQLQTVVLPSGSLADLTEVGNFGNDLLSREYIGLHTQFRYRLNDRLTIAATYALSQLDGNIDGETTTGGPAPFSPRSFSEYTEERWNYPTGDLANDQRHKLRAWAVFDIFNNDRNSLSVGLMQNFFSGSPYAAVGTVDARPFVTNPGYQIPPSSVNYFFTGRDAFTTDDITRTDLSLNYSFKWKAFGKSMEVFIQPEILNLFDESNVIDVNTSVLTEDNSSLAAFNPFTETPVQGVHYEFGDDFGQPENEDDFQRPRLFRLSIGFRF